MTTTRKKSAAKQLATIEKDRHGPYIAWGANGSIYRPRKSTTSNSTVNIFNKERSVAVATQRTAGDLREVLNVNDAAGRQYILVFDKDLREVWAWHGINTNTATKAYTPLVEDAASSKILGDGWSNTKKWVGILYSRALQW